MDILNDFSFSHGTSIHKCSCHADQPPHLTGSLLGETEHIPYYGQTTLGMFDQSLGGHTFDEVDHLHSQFPSVFRDSGLKW